LDAPTELQVIAQQNGMFSMLPLNDGQMSVLREKHGIYGVPNGRINIAGLRQSEIKPLAEGLVDVMEN
jgi:aspartate aminotransferase